MTATDADGNPGRNGCKRPEGIPHRASEDLNVMFLELAINNDAGQDSSRRERGGGGGLGEENRKCDPHCGRFVCDSCSGSRR